MYPRQTLVLEYVKTAAIVLGIIFAVLELRDRTDQAEIAQSAQSAAMLSAFKDPAMADGSVELIEAELDPLRNRSEYVAFLKKVTPVRQHLIAWSACIEGSMCKGGVTKTLFC